MKKKILITLAVFVCLFACIFAIGISAENNEPKLEFKAYNLTYGNSVYITYAAYCENLPEGVKPQLLVWDAPQEKYIKGTEKHSAYSYKQQTVKGVLCDVFTYDKILAREMAKDFYAVIYAKVGDVEYYSAPAKYSVLQYVYNKLGYTGTASDNEKYKNLLKGTLEYGALAQDYFTDGEDTRLANLPFYQVVTSGGTLPDGFEKGLYLEGDKLTITAPKIDKNGEVFSHWEDETGKNVSSSSIFDIVVENKHKTYTACYYTQIMEPTIVIGTAAGSVGDEVEVVFTLVNSPELYAMSLKIAFDDVALELVSAESGEAMDSFVYTNPSRLKNGSNFMWYANDPAVSNGIVLKMVFKIKDTAVVGNYSISMTCDPSNTYDVDDNDVELNFVNGSIVVTE